MSIDLIDVLNFPRFEDVHDYKVHLANWNGQDRPLDVFVRDKNEWKMWNSWQSGKNDFNRKYIFSLIEFYPESNIWLFGGVFKVKQFLNKPKDYGYIVELTDKFKPYIGRLKIQWERDGRAKARKFESCIGEFEVAELLKEEFTGITFCGYENINHDFHVLESIIKNQKQDWRVALINVKGIYLILDKKNGKSYVGSAYGDAGIWSRWSCYIGNGHGHTDELTKLIKKKGIEYARENFKFVLLEYRPMKTDDKTIFNRENYWKEALLTRGKFGYNNN